MRTACEVPFLKSLVLAMATTVRMTTYIFTAEEMSIMPSVSSICGVSYIDIPRNRNEIL